MSIRGLDSLADIIDLLKNPSKYDAKMKELRGEIDRYYAAIESVTKLSDVNEYTLNIREKSKQVDAEYEKAKQETTAMLDSARQESATIKAAVKEAQIRLKLREDKLKTEEESFSVRAKEVDSLNEVLAKRSDELRVKEEQLSAQAADLAERKKKLLAAIG